MKAIKNDIRIISFYFSDVLKSCRNAGFINIGRGNVCTDQDIVKYVEKTIASISIYLEIFKQGCTEYQASRYRLNPDTRLKSGYSDRYLESNKNRKYSYEYLRPERDQQCFCYMLQYININYSLLYTYNLRLLTFPQKKI